MRETMTSRERAFASFAHKKVDRVPVWLTDGNTWIIDDAGISYADLYAMDDKGVDLLLKGFEKLNCDLVASGSAWIAWANAFGCPIVTNKVGLPIDVSPCINDPDVDIPKLDKSKIKELIADNELCQATLTQIRLFKEKAGNDKVIQFDTSAPFTLANVMVGVQDFMVLMGEENENLAPLMDFAAAANAELCNQAIEAGCDVVFCGDPNASADLISQRMFEDVVVPCTKNFAAQLKNCKYVCIHICGQSTPRITSLMEMGISGMSVDSPVDIKAAMNVTHKKMSMMGNINTYDILLNGTPEQVYQLSLDYALYAGLESGYFLMAGCDFPAKTPVENIGAMLRAARDAADQLS